MSVPAITSIGFGAWGGIADITTIGFGFGGGVAGFDKNTGITQKMKMALARRDHDRRLAEMDEQDIQDILKQVMPYITKGRL